MLQRELVLSKAFVCLPHMDERRGNIRMMADKQAPTHTQTKLKLLQRLRVLA